MAINSPIRCLLVIAALALPSTASSQEMPNWFIYLATTPKVLRLNALKVNANGPNLNQLLEKRHNVALEELVARHSEFLEGRGTVEFLYDAAIRLRKSRLELARDKAARVAIMQDHIDWTKVIEAIGKVQHEAGKWPTKMYNEAKYRRIQAEIDLLRIVETR